MPSAAKPNKTTLNEILQVNALGRNTCKIHVTTPEGRGFVYMENGDVIDAVYGDLSGKDAFVALITSDRIQSHVNSGIRAEQRRISSDLPSLILTAMNLREEGKVRVPRFPDSATKPALSVVPEMPRDSPGVPAGSALESRREAEVPLAPETPHSQPLVVETAPAEREKQASPRTGPLAAPLTPTAPAPSSKTGILIGSAVIVCLLAAGVLFLMKKDAPQASSLSPTQAPGAPTGPSEPAVESTMLTGPADALPNLQSGDLPRLPDPESAVSPTIVCRILVNADGSVAEAKVFQSRLDLAAFEEAALTSVRKFRFSPGLRNGKPVPVWINWPVSFRP